MALYRGHAFFLSFVLFLAIISTTPYVAQGSVAVYLPGISVTGNLFCSPTGNPSPITVSAPVVNANVTVSCSNITTRVVTNVNGFFSATLIPQINVSVSLNLTATTLLPNCTATIQLPVAGCPLLPVKGVLRGVLAPVGLITDSSLISSILGDLGIISGLVKGVLLSATVIGYTVGV
ncbi:hypothetical protein ACH5RR_016011 [Cinchona calisaya]|uniref:Uncharacterized protein n=1 Tax=Cinchona calisaya TaxID=153742 RepID=A0ABD2ZXG3_9GENT